MYKVELSREAQRFYNQCDKPIAKKLARCFQSLEKNPRQRNNVKPLKGEFAGSFRYRVGDLRIVYTINDRAVVVFVITIANVATYTSNPPSDDPDRFFGSNFRGEPCPRSGGSRNRVHPGNAM